MRPDSPSGGASDSIAYDFGTNWRRFVDAYLDQDRVDRARRSLSDFLGLESLRGKSFLDIGCGSGLFSLAAHDLGAKRIVSVDVNPGSIACCQELRRSRGDSECWSVTQGSVLDEALMGDLGLFDIVYSWGVLHHTGRMWDAIEIAAKRVAPGGYFFIAIYNKADSIGLHSDGRPGTWRLWQLEKRIYVSLPSFGKRMVDALCAVGMVLGYLLRGRNPIREIRGHRSLRGMSWMVDLRDWLGGYPYEAASVAEIFHFVRTHLDAELINLTSVNSLVNNEFLFRRRGAEKTTSGEGDRNCE